MTESHDHDHVEHDHVEREVVVTNGGGGGGGMILAVIIGVLVILLAVWLFSNFGGEETDVVPDEVNVTIDDGSEG